MKSRLYLTVTVGVLMISFMLSGCIGYMYRTSVKGDQMRKRNGTYHKKHYHGRAGGWY